MYRYMLRRVLFAIPVLFALIVTVFSLMRAIPGGPFDFEGDLSLSGPVITNLRRMYHLDEPFTKQFVRYLAGDFVDTGNLLDIGKHGLLGGDLGMALRERGRTVNEVVAGAFPISIQLGVMALFFGLMLGVPLGTLAAVKQNTWIDYGSTLVAIIGISIPALVMGPLLQWIFAIKLGWLPVATWGALPPFFLGVFPTLSVGFVTHAILPVVTLGTALSASIARLTRASVLQVIREDYIRTARAKGLRESVVISRHALRNSLIPVVTMLGPMLAHVVTGTFVIEQMFGIPGMGRYFIQSIANRDYAIIQGLTLIFATLLVLANLFVDLSYAWLDPRIRYS